VADVAGESVCAADVGIYANGALVLARDLDNIGQRQLLIVA
jgi:hypothetical protein